MKTLIYLLLLALPAALPGCAKKAESSYDYAPPAEAYYDDDYEDDASGFAEAESYKRSEAIGGLGDLMSGGDDARQASAPTASPEPTEPEPTEPEQPAAEQPQARKVHYNGWVSLLATDPEQAVAEVVALAEQSGGYVERRTLSEATVRVPVDDFKATWDAALALGDVLDKSLTAEDITDAYLAVELRLKTARATRARLQELLAAATDEAEKLALLREIQRLTEEIDLMESRFRTLAQLAGFSRLTVQVTPRQAYSQGSDRPEISGFHWIRQLSPFRRDVSRSGRPLDLAVPEGLVALDIKRHFVAESADGAVVWSGRIPNDPEGDTDYWMAAIRERLEPEFTGAEVTRVGAFAVLRLLEPGTDAPYRYLVGVRADGRWLELVEVYYPGQEQEERYGEAVRASLLAAGGAS